MDDSLVDDAEISSREKGNGTESEVEGGMRRLAVRDARATRPTRAAAQAAQVKVKTFQLDFDGDAVMGDEEELEEKEDEEEGAEPTPQPPSKKPKAETQKKATKPKARSNRGSSRKPKYSDEDEEEEEEDLNLDEESEQETLQRRSKGGRSSAPSIPTRGASVEPTMASGRSKRAAASKARRVIESSEDEFED